MASTVPKVVSVEVVAARPTDTDRTMIAQLAADAKRSMPETAFIVKIALQEIPAPTGRGWALYVGDTRIPKDWETPAGFTSRSSTSRFSRSISERSCGSRKTARTSSMPA